MTLGRADTLAKREDVVRFFGWHDRGVAVPLHHNLARHRGLPL
jgi:hypothetical protein